MPGPEQKGRSQGGIGETPPILPIPVPPDDFALIIVRPDELGERKPPQQGLGWSGIKFGSFELIKPEVRTRFTLVDSQREAQPLQSHSPFNEISEWFGNLPENARVTVSKVVPEAVGLIERHTRSLADEIYYAGKLAPIAGRKAKEIGQGIIEAVIYPDKTAQKLGSLAVSTVRGIGDVAENARKHPMRVVGPVALAAGLAACGRPAEGPSFTVEPISSPAPAGLVTPSVEAGRTPFPTPLPTTEGSGKPAEVTPTSTTMVAGEITPQAQKNIDNYVNALYDFLQKQFVGTKGKGDIPLLTFADARTNRNNPVVYSIFSDQPGISRRPTAENPSFVIGGNLFIALRESNTGNGVIHPVQAPNVDYTQMYFNFGRMTWEFYDASGNLVAHIPISPTSIGATITDKLSVPTVTVPKPTEAPTATATAEPTRTATPEPTATRVPLPSFEQEFGQMSLLWKAPMSLGAASMVHSVGGTVEMDATDKDPIYRLIAEYLHLDNHTIQISNVPIDKGGTSRAQVDHKGFDVIAPYQVLVPIKLGTDIKISNGLTLGTVFRGRGYDEIAYLYGVTSDGRAVIFTGDGKKAIGYNRGGIIDKGYWYVWDIRPQADGNVELYTHFPLIIEDSPGSYKLVGWKTVKQATTKTYAATQGRPETVDGAGHFESAYGQFEGTVFGGQPQIRK